MGSASSSMSTGLVPISGGGALMPIGGGGILPINQLHPGLWERPELSPLNFDLDKNGGSSLGSITDYSDILKPMSKHDYQVWQSENPEFYEQLRQSVLEEYGINLDDTYDTTDPKAEEKTYEGNEKVFQFTATLKICERS